MVQSYDIVKKIFLSFYLQFSNPFCKLFDLILKKVQVKLNVKYISNSIFRDWTRIGSGLDQDCIRIGSGLDQDWIQVGS